MDIESATDAEVDDPSGGVAKGPKHVDLPADGNVLREARQLASDRNVRISKLSQTVSQDPVITLELMRIANATFFSGDRPAISTVHTAVIRLGSKAIVEALDKLAERSELLDPDVFTEFEALRSTARKTSVVASIISSVLQRDIADTCLTAGLVSYIGHMLVCVYLGDEYVQLARTRKRSAMPYRLQQEYGIDIERVMLDYLRSQGLPSLLFFALDRELKCKTTSQSGLRFIVASAIEMVEAFEDGRLDKFAPNRQLPSKSSLRLLKFTPAQYTDIYESVEDFLSGKIVDDSHPEAEIQLVNDSAEIEQTSPHEDEEVEEVVPVRARPEPEPAPRAQITLRRGGFDRRTQPERPTLVLTGRGYAAYDPAAQPTNFIEHPEDEILQEEVQKLSPDAQQVLGLIKGLCGRSPSAQDLLLNLIRMLTTEAPFVRAALIVLKDHRQSADIHTAIGDGFIDGAVIQVKDPLSPLSLCLTQIKSFNAKDFEDVISPFGCSSYAISPIRVKHSDPVVLYADCGADAPLPFEARKVFRLVVGLLNHTLPKLPGGLPEKSVRSIGRAKHFSA